MSIDGKGAWCDNLFVGRLRPTVKYEQVCPRDHAGLAEARASIGRYLDFFYGKRPNSPLGGETPGQASIDVATPIPAAA